MNAAAAIAALVAIASILINANVGKGEGIPPIMGLVGLLVLGWALARLGVKETQRDG